MPPSATVTAPRPRAALPPAPATRVRSLRARLARHLWLALLPVAFVVYAASFSTFSVIDRQHSVLGDGDAANFALIVREFGWAHRFGDEYATSPRTVGDIAQKHKVHHVVYAAVGHGIYRVLRPAYEAVGLSARRALYSVNALVAVANLVLLFLLLRRHNPAGNPVAPFLVLYAGALNTWLFSSVPESWPFSATLVLGYLLLLPRRPLRPWWLGAVLGVVMLNNVFLSMLWVLLVVQLARAGQRGPALARNAFVAGLVAVGTWAGGLTLLSRFDSSFRPDHFVAYTLWFKQYTARELSPLDPYAWKSASTNLLVNSVVSNQPDPSVPQEALGTTLRTSRLGAAATAAYLALVLVAGTALVRTVGAARRRGGWGGAFGDPALDLALWCGVMLAVTIGLFYSSGFLYSTVVVPAIVVVLCRYLDLRIAWQKALVYGAVALILVNNGSQVLQFREALRALS